MSGRPARRVDVLVLLASVYDGDTRVHKEVAALREAGASVLVVSLSRAGVRSARPGVGRGRDGELVSVVPVRPLRPRTGIGANARNLVASYLPALASMATTALRSRATVVHANDAQTLPLAVLCKLSGRAERLVFDAHEDSGRLVARGSLLAALAPLWRAVLRWAAPHVDHTLTVGNTLAGRCRDGGLEPVTVIRNVPVVTSSPRRIEDDAVVGAPRPSIAEAAVDEVDRSPLRLVYLGSMYPGRGLETALHGMRLLADLPVTLTMVGQPNPLWYRREVERLVVEAGPRTRLLPRVAPDDVARVYAAHDVGLVLLDVVPEHEVYLPNKVFEIMMAGLPVVATRLPDIVDELATSRAGVVFDGTPEGFATVCRELFEDPGRRRELARAAHVAATTRNNWSREQARFLEVYAALGIPGGDDQPA